MTTPDIPSTMRALVVQKNRTAAIQQIPVPTLGDNQMLIKVQAIALNPTDWKHIKFISTPGSLVGIDLAGEVVKLGDNIDPKVTIQIGDRVVSAVHGGLYPDQGAVAEYVKVDADLVWKIPEDIISMQQAVTFGVGFLSAVQAMFHPDRLALTEYPNKAEDGTWIFIYGGSTSVGQNAIQLAHISGYKIATVASPRNHELLKELGADLVLDYRDPKFVEAIKIATGDSIHSALDCHSEGDSQLKCVKVLAPGPGKVYCLWYPPASVLTLRSDVKVETTMLYTMWARPWKMMGKTSNPDPSDKAQIVELMRDKLPELIKDHKIKPMKIKLGDGLDKINEGFAYMIAGKVNAEKLVYNI